MSVVHFLVWGSLVFVTLTGDEAPAADVAEAALRATVRVTAEGKSGTGFFVTLPTSDGMKPATVLVTAAHVFDELSSPKCKLVFRTPDAEAGFVRLEKEVTVKDGDKKLWVRHPVTDLAVLGVELPENADVQPFTLNQVADTRLVEDRMVRVGQEVWIPCFPAQVEANPAGWPLLRRGTLATHPLTPVARTPTMFVDYSHFGGDSGAPVVATVNGEPLVVGLVFAMLRQTDKAVMPFEERTHHTPLGLAVAAQAPLIRQTIEAWAEAHRQP